MVSVLCSFSDPVRNWRAAEGAKTAAGYSRLPEGFSFGVGSAIEVKLLQSVRHSHVVICSLKNDYDAGRSPETGDEPTARR